MGFITEAVVATRTYVAGREAGLTLLQMTEGYRAGRRRAPESVVSVHL